jgi:protein involved in polysaccharide export with SLBB domain
MIFPAPEDAMPLPHIPTPRFGLKNLLVLILGIAIGFSLNSKPLKMLAARFRGSPPPPYVIEPPDVLQINVIGGESENRTSITGSHMVGPDGRVSLGNWGNVYVAGMTIREAQSAIEKTIAKSLPSPRVAIDITAYNSKKYYVITQQAGGPDSVDEFQFTGSETVLDAIAQLGGIQSKTVQQVVVARPAPNGAGASSTLLVDWAQIASGKSADTNYQLQPRDRVIISSRPAATLAE